jgi:hypothetical protein
MSARRIFVPPLLNHPARPTTEGPILIGTGDNSCFGDEQFQMRQLSF